jgi:hypothetical protein
MSDVSKYVIVAVLSFLRDDGILKFRVRIELWAFPEVITSLELAASIEVTQHPVSNAQRWRHRCPRTPRRAPTDLKRFDWRKIMMWNVRSLNYLR